MLKPTSKNFVEFIRLKVIYILNSFESLDLFVISPTFLIQKNFFLCHILKKYFITSKTLFSKCKFYWNQFEIAATIQKMFLYPQFFKIIIIFRFLFKKRHRFSTILKIRQFKN